MISEEKYLFTLVQEECAEISQVASKIIRFGLYNVAPGTAKDNLTRLKEEVVDLLGIISMTEIYLKEHIIEKNISLLADKMSTKIAKVKKYMEYSRDRGELQ